MSDIQTALLEKLTQVSKRLDADHSEKSSLAEDISVIKTKLNTIEIENSKQTAEIKNVKDTLEKHNTEFQEFKHKTAKDIDDIKIDQRTTVADLKDHMKAEESEIKGIHNEVLSYNKSIDALVDSLPRTHDDKPDFRAHRQDHDTLKDEKITWNRRKDKILDHILSGISWAAVVGIGLAIWEFVKVKMGGG